MKYLLVAVALLLSFSSKAQTPLLLEIAKAVSVAVLSDAAKVSLNEFLNTEPEKPTEFDKVKIKELANRALSYRTERSARLKLFAPIVDFYGHGNISRQEVVDLPTWALGYEISSIDLIEVDRKGRFAAVSCTLRSFKFRIFKRNAPYEYSAVVILIGDYTVLPKIYAIKNRT